MPNVIYVKIMDSDGNVTVLELPANRFQKEATE